MTVNQLKAGAILNYASIGLHTLISLLYTPYMLRMLGQSEYGLYALVGSVISYLTVLDLGFGNAIVRYTAKYKAEGKTEEQYCLFGMFFSLYMIIGIVAFVAGLGLYFNVENMFGDTMTAYELGRAKILMLIMIFNLAISFPFSIYGSILTAYEDFVFRKIFGIATTLLNVAVMIVLLHYGYKTIAMVVLSTVINIVTIAVNYIYLKKNYTVKFTFGKFDWSLLREIAIYSFWIFLNVIMDRIYWSTGQFVLGATVGTVAVAVFAIAIALQGMFMSFSTAIVGVFLPRVTSMVVTATKEEISNMFIRIGRIQYIIVSFILVGYIVFGKQFITLWAGEEYEPAYLMALLFLISLAEPLIQNLGITILQARNQMKFRSTLYIIIAAISLGFQIVLSKYYGGLGCAIAISGALILGQGIIMNWYYYKRQALNIPKFWHEILKMSLVPVIFAVVGVIAFNYIQINSFTTLFISIAIFSLLYIPLFGKLGMNDSERELFNGIFRKLKLKKAKI